MLLSKICDAMKTIEKISVDCGNPDEKNDQKTGNISDNDQRICDISNIEIDGITLDSRKVQEGFMFEIGRAHV